jgi:hypothetical protein
MQPAVLNTEIKKTQPIAELSVLNELTYWQYRSGFGSGAKPLQIKDLRKAK